MMKFLQKVLSVSAKFCQIFRRKYLKNHNIGLTWSAFRPPEFSAAAGFPPPAARSTFLPAD
jgi:hypothetical protein